MTKPKMPEKSQKQKPPCGSAFHCILHFHKLYLYKTRTKHKRYVPSYSKRLSQNITRKSQKEKPTCNSAFHYILPFHKLYFYKTTTKHKKFMFLATKIDLAKIMPEKANNKTSLQHPMPHSR